METKPQKPQSRLVSIVKEEMFRSNVSMQDAAKAIGVSNGTLAELLHQRAATSRKTWALVSAWLGVTTESLKVHCKQHDEGHEMPEPLRPAAPARR